MSKVSTLQINSIVNNKSIKSFSNVMTKNKLLGIFLACTMLCGSIPLGFSEPILQQWEKTNDINVIQCNNENHVLVMRGNGMPACVTEKSASKMGWQIIQNSLSEIVPMYHDTIKDNSSVQSEIVETSESSENSSQNFSENEYGDVSYAMNQGKFETSSSNDTSSVIGSKQIPALKDLQEQKENLLEKIQETKQKIETIYDERYPITQIYGALDDDEVDEIDRLKNILNVSKQKMDELRLLIADYGTGNLMGAVIYWKVSGVIIESSSC